MESRQGYCKIALTIAQADVCHKGMRQAVRAVLRRNERRSCFAGMYP